jgi:hypothetical protein
MPIIPFIDPCQLFAAAAPQQPNSISVTPAAIITDWVCNVCTNPQMINHIPAVKFINACHISFSILF